MNNFSVLSVVSDTFSTVWKKLGVCLTATFLMFLVSSVGKKLLTLAMLHANVAEQGFQALLTTNGLPFWGIVFVHTFVVAWMTLGVMKLMLSVEHASIDSVPGMLFTGNNPAFIRWVYFLPIYFLSLATLAAPFWLVGYLLSPLGSSVLVPFVILLTCIMGYLIARIWFHMFFMIDKDMHALEAIYASWDLSRGKVLSLFGAFVLMILGVICVTVPFTVLAALVVSPVGPYGFILPGITEAFTTLTLYLMMAKSYKALGA